MGPKLNRYVPYSVLTFDPPTADNTVGLAETHCNPSSMARKPFIRPSVKEQQGISRTYLDGLHDVKRVLLNFRYHLLTGVDGWMPAVSSSCLTSHLSLKHEV